MTSKSDSSAARGASEYGEESPLLRRLGATGLGVWTIKHIVSPLDRVIYQLTGGKVVSLGRSAGPILLLMTKGRRTGKERTTPVFYLRAGDQIVLCNVNPEFEHANPWVLNLQAHPFARAQIGFEIKTYCARVANEDETNHYWPQLVQLWPAYQAHFERSGQRVVFILDPRQAQPAADQERK